MKQFLTQWLRSRLAWLVLLGLVLGLLLGFALVFENLQPVLFYQVSLLTVFILICGLWDLVREWRKYQQGLQERAVAKSGLSPLEMVLQDQIARQKEQIKAQQVIARSKQEETLDYFTLWAHQIKTPLTASQLLLKELPDSQTKKDLSQELFRVGQYADMAMTYLRLESFHEDLVLTEVDLYDLVREVVKKYALFFIQQSIQLDLQPFDKTVTTDSKWLAVVLEQILSNAVKYTRTGTISIYLEDDRLIVADTGMGIQQSDLNRVFERGFSGFNGRVSQQSSGLGLYLSKTIMEKLGHQIALTSQVGEGTQVILQFPKATLAQD
ncbi:sensor histidine kinase [Streptococcus moroccensis]|uniref:histidine kinase n=1 Tax=Streptococcus moroccensis TaxID=1451356 RepID=A0ABT9YNY7_9STRE|nr:sensor histidine kinase [Streptococcus moroccensis]MDQ0221597.1 signal transduction histidine kinase [Streptococcus moroccensis]